MNRRWFIAIVSVGLILATVWQLHGWNMRREAKRLNTQRSREIAEVFIREGYLHIGIGEGKPWRQIYERLLNERFGIKFHHPPSGSFCGYLGDFDEAMESAMMKMNDEEVARRFKPGQLESMAEEAVRIYRIQQENGMLESR